MRAVPQEQSAKRAVPQTHRPSVAGGGLCKGFEPGGKRGRVLSRRGKHASKLRVAGMRPRQGMCVGLEGDAAERVCHASIWSVKLGRHSALRAQITKCGHGLERIVA